MELNGQNFQNNSNGLGGMNSYPGQQNMNPNQDMNIGGFNNDSTFNQGNVGGQSQGFGGIELNSGMGTTQNSNMGGYYNQNMNTNMYTQGYNGMQQPNKKPVLGLVSLILAILSVVICCFTPWFAIPAIVLGVIALVKNKSDKKGLVGIIIAAIALIISIVLSLVFGGIGSLITDMLEDSGYDTEYNDTDDYLDDDYSDDDYSDDSYFDDDDITENLDDSESEMETEEESEVETGVDSEEDTENKENTVVTEGDLTSNSSTDWRDAVIVFEGVKYTLPFDYAEIKENGWSFDIADYGYPDGYILNPKDKVSSTIDLTKAEYSYEYSWDNIEVSAGFQNLGDKAVDIYDSKMWSFGLSVASSFGNFEDAYPSLILAKDITWGAKYHNIIAAYGEPQDTYRSDDLGYYALTYDTWDESGRKSDVKMRLVVYDKSGLTEVEISVLQ